MATYESKRYDYTGAALTALNGANIGYGTFAQARVAAGSVTQHVDLTTLNASNLTSGTIPNARYSTPTFDGTNITSVGTGVASSIGVVNSYAAVTGTVNSGSFNTDIAGNNLRYSALDSSSHTTWQGQNGTSALSGTWRISGGGIQVYDTGYGRGSIAVRKC